MKTLSDILTEARLLVKGAIIHDQYCVEGVDALRLIADLCEFLDSQRRTRVVKFSQRLTDEGNFTAQVERILRKIKKEDALTLALFLDSIEEAPSLIIKEVSHLYAPEWGNL